MLEKFCLNITNNIKKKMPNISEERIEIINFGLLVIFGEFPKIILIFLVAYWLNILTLTVITFVAMAIYRTQSGGFHLDGHISCLAFSLLIFCGTGLLAQSIVTTNIYLLHGLYLLIFIFNVIIIKKYAPADTEMIPVINPKLRKKKKIKSYIAVSLLYIFALFISPQQVISNICVLTTFIQSCSMTQLAYKLSKCEYGEVTKLQLDIR